MTVTTSPTVAQRALQSRIIQEFLAHGDDLVGNAFGFPRSSADFTYFSPQQIGQMAQRAAYIYHKAGLPCEATATAMVVGLRAVSTVEWVVSFLTLVRAGYTIFVLSPALSIEAVRVLMLKADCKYLVDGTSDLSNLKQHGNVIVPLATLDQLCANMKTSELVDKSEFSMNWSKISEDDPALIIHSSGTTGLPKLIPKTHRELLTRLRTIPPVCHDKSFFVGSWLYYMVGIYSMMFSFVKTGGPTCWANEKLPLTSEACKEVLMETRPDMAYFNPVTLIAAASTKQGLDILKECIMVTSTGAVLPEQLGNNLVKSGVHLADEYGMSELSVGLSSAMRPPGDRDWNYLQPDPLTAPHIHFRPLSKQEGSTWAGGEQLYELIVLPTHPTQDKQWANSADGSFHTGDLFIKHPTAQRYKCTGRMCDDVKICPEHDVVGLKAVLYEQKIKAGNEDIIDEAVLFGNERPEPGVLLFVRSSSKTSSEVVLERVWVTIKQEINGVLPVGLAKNMLVIVQDAVVPRTPKGSIIRPEVYLKFERMVDKAYGAE